MNWAMIPEGNKRIYRDTGKMLLMLLGGTVFFGLCFLAFLDEIHKGKLGPFKEMLSWGGFAFVGLGVFYGFIKMFDRRPALEFLEEGLIARDISADLIPWAGIAGVGFRQMKSSGFLELQLTPDMLKTIRPSVIASATSPTA
jgi:hypothetical protein